MQNIPSHSTDIRHMFRATPEQTEQIKVEEKNGEVNINLSKHDMVNTPDGKVKVKDLAEGSIVILKEDGKEVQYSISTINFDKGQSEIHMKRNI